MSVTDTDAASADQYRLPRIVTPVRYELTLEPDLEHFSFAGSCRTEIEVSAATGVIVLNAIEL